MRAALLKSRIRSILRCDFARREDGVIALEAMIMLPLLFWTFLALFSIFDTFRTYSANQKAAFTVGDAISRETMPIDDQYLAGIHEMFEYLALSNGGSSMRVSSIYFDEENNRHYTDWSQAVGGRSPLSDGDIGNWSNKLPIMVNNERLVLVETWASYDPPFKTGLEQREIRNFNFTRPRYAPRVCWLTCN
jgi:hypothetical protein